MGIFNIFKKEVSVSQGIIKCNEIFLNKDILDSLKIYVEDKSRGSDYGD